MDEHSSNKGFTVSGYSLPEIASEKSDILYIDLIFWFMDLEHEYENLFRYSSFHLRRDRYIFLQSSIIASSRADITQENCAKFIIKYLQKLRTSSQVDISLKSYPFIDLGDWNSENVWAVPFPYDTLTQYTCEGRPLYGEIVSFLDVNTTRGKYRVNVKKWQPENPQDFEIIWHWLVTLSNGEQYIMKMPICSIDRWYKTLKKHLEKSKSPFVSPESRVHITVATGYHPEEYENEIQTFLRNIKAGSITELLIKISHRLNFANRDLYLQKPLLPEDYSLEFSGRVVFE